ncbi:MAG: hypothetical protein FD133_872 [Erysipelotrichaceae bacterium]|nr:MAG: hypothetical protein FD179_778 [Erysipelotrichaceae bacterium]TXT18376.1 MAG: hypothetical protein FD133_872 [Erysipelotrichaceae bacterium]
MRTFIRRVIEPPGPRKLLPEKVLADAKEIYAKMGKYAVEESMLLVRVPIDSAEYQMILDYEAKYQEYFPKKKRHYILEKEFTLQELNEAEYLILFVGNLTYPVYDGRFEFCCDKKCYSHSFRYRVPYRIESKSLGNKHLGNMTDDGYVVSIALKNELEKHNLTNLVFIPALKGRGDEIVGYRLETKHLLPPLEYFDQSKILMRCQTTGIPVYTNEIEDLLEIKRSVALAMDDFNATYELMTSTGIRFYIISQRMYRIIKQFTIRSFECEPIKIIPD